MTSQQSANLALARWQAMKDLPPAERIKRLEEYERGLETLRQVMARAK